jgi:FeS assembly SUF system protein
MDGKLTDTGMMATSTIDKTEAVESAARPEAAGDQGAVLPAADADDPLLRDIVAALKSVYDPEIPADIYELGLIYSVDVDDDRNVAIAMTLTAPGCPVAGEMPMWVENAVNAVPGVKSTTVRMTFDPPWDMSRMSDEARLALNMF